MNIKFSLTFLFLALMATQVFATGDKDKKTVNADVKSSKLKWTGEKVTGEHYGHLTLKSGSLTVDGDKLTGGEFTIDMTSITCDDIEDKKTNAKLLGHLKSDDFFSVEKHNTAKFKVTKVTPRKDGSYRIAGDLTIKGITNQVSFPATVKIEKGGAVTADAEILVDRTKYDVRYGSGSFFDKLGDRTIYDEFKIDLHLEAK